MNPFPFDEKPVAAVPPPVDDSPVTRLAHTVAVYNDPRSYRGDGEWAVTATTHAYGPAGPARTGLTWGDLRALLADLTACPMCLTNCGHPEQCGAELDEPEDAKLIHRFIVHAEWRQGRLPRLSVRRAPRHDDRVIDGGKWGTLQACPECSGAGFLHAPDAIPALVAPQP